MKDADYSNEFFYKPALLNLSINRIRTKPIGEVLQFISVETRGNSGSNVNYDEINAIIHDLDSRIKSGFRELKTANTATLICGAFIR